MNGHTDLARMVPDLAAAAHLQILPHRTASKPQHTANAR
jgi:hypothetical protein